MLPFDEDDGGDFDFDETTQAERDLAPDSPEEDLVDDHAEPDESDLAGDIDDVDDDTLSAFVASVVLTNAGVFAVSLGLMLWYFRGMRQVGGGLVVVGLLALIRTYQYYYEWKQSREEDTADEGEEGEEGDAGDEGGAGDEGDAGDESNAGHVSGETDGAGDAPDQSD